MPTVEERYTAATAYVRRAIATVEDRGLTYTIDPITGLVEWYAGKTKTQQPRNELAHIEARWLRATSDSARAGIAREAELLADRVEETLPGAPQNRARTNLYPGETPKGTPATSYAQEVDAQADEVWDWARHKASSVAAGASSLGKWFLLGGGIVLGWKTVNYLRARQRTLGAEGDDNRLLNAGLERAAEGRNAGSTHRRRQSFSPEAATELDLFAENEAALYPQYRAIVATLKRRVENGTYDPQLAPKAWLHWYTRAAQLYVKSFGGDVAAMFPKALRMHLAGERAADEYLRIRSGEHD